MPKPSRQPKVRRLPPPRRPSPAPDHTLRNFLWKDALGDLTLGFIHDLNNALAGVVSFSNLAALEPSAPGPLRDYFLGIQESTRRVTAVIERFARLMQCKPARPSLQDAARLTAEAFAFLRATVPRRIEMELRGAAPSLPVMAPERDLRLALFELVLRAADGMEGKGRIVVEAAQEASGGVGRARGRGRKAAPASGWAVIAVRDNGRPRPSLSAEGTGAPQAAATAADLAWDHAGRIAQELGGVLLLEPDAAQGNVATLRIPLADLEQLEI